MSNLDIPNGESKKKKNLKIHRKSKNIKTKLKIRKSNEHSE